MTTVNGWMDICRSNLQNKKKKKAIKDRQYHSKKVSGGNIKIGGEEEVRSSPYQLGAKI
jgi:hypothetical protein